jgi:hypothetical protein
MPQFKCLACMTRLRSAETPADPIDLCPVCGSLLEPVGDLGEIVGYRVIETRGGTLHRGASRAGRLIAGRVGEIIARRELGHARIRPEIESSDANSVSRQVQAVSSRAPGTGDEAVRRRRRAPHHSRAAATAPASFKLSTTGVIGANVAARRSSHFALGLGSAGAPRNGIDAQPRRRRQSREGADAIITIDVFLVGKLRSDMSPFEPRGPNSNATRCQ